MGHRARVVVLFAAFAFALVACNALTGASDLQFDESASTKPADAEAGATTVDAADAAPCTADPIANVESVSSTPTAAVDDPRVGVVPWSITALGGAGGAHLTLNANQLTHYLRTSSFGFAANVPQDAVIRGIQVAISRTADFPDEVTDYGVVLVKNNVPGGESKTFGATWEGGAFGNARTATYGGATDLWNDDSWTTTDIRSLGFGVALAVRGVDASMTQVQVMATTVTVSFVRCLK